MAFSNQTTHYGLPLPSGSDKSTWLDTNTAFQAIDSALYEAAQASGSGSTAIAELQSQMSTANANITANTTAIASEASTRAAADTAHSNAISTINTKLGSTSMAGHGDETITGILMDIVSKYDELRADLVDEELTYTDASPSKITLSNFKIITNHLGIQCAGSFTMAGGGVATELMPDGAYGIKIATIAADEMSEKFPNLTTGDHYSIGQFMITQSATRAWNSTSGQSNSALSTTATMRIIKQANGTGLIYCFGQSSQNTIYAKTATGSTTIGMMVDVGSAGTISFTSVGGMYMRTVSETLPGIE